MSNRINILDSAVAARIAAGEVITNPAAVVKELIENAMDAGSTAITVEIAGGGGELVRVTDNGSGMEPDDVPLSIRKHATSKIKGLADLSSIGTLGFRGEALASMAAVSRLTIKTRTSGSLSGTVLCINGGGEAELSSAGLPEGTTVKVENLFYNVPARQKFLKNPSRETAAITNIVSKMILAHPNIAFKYVNSGKLIYQSAGRGQLKEALATVFGKDIYDKILPVSYDYGGIGVSGFLSRPSFLYKNAGNILFYLKGRYIQSKNMQQAVMRGYGERILRSHFPFAVLNLTLAYDLVDINVHPSKLQVMFLQEAAVLDALSRAVASALKENTTPNISLPAQSTETKAEITAQNDNLPRLNNADHLYKSTLKAADSALQLMNDTPQVPFPVSMPHNAPGRPMHKKENDKDVFMPPQQFDAVIAAIAEQQDVLAEEAVQTDIQDVRQMVDYRVVGQIFSTYLICECGTTLYLIDQHAAHERLTYEAMKKQLQVGGMPSQRLLVPVVKRLSHQDFSCLTDHLKLLDSLGFEAEEFGPLTVKFSAFPAQADQSGADVLIDDLLYELKNHSGDIVLLRDRIVRAACRHSIKAGYRLPDSQIGSLIAELTRMTAIPTCPHGRPIAVAITKEELQKGFKRTL